MSVKLSIGICLIAIGVLSFVAALAFADWRWLLITILCCIVVRAA